MDETVKSVIAFIIIALYLIGVTLCAYYIGAHDKKNCDGCCKCIKKYNFFGDRVDEEPKIYFEV